MTTTANVPEILPAPRPMMRYISVMRLHFVNTFQLVAAPWLIVSFIFAISLLLGAIFRSSMSAADVAEAEAGMQFSGAMGFFLVYMLVLAVMSISQTFPFAQSYSVTRRDFFIGTVLTFVSLSVLYALAITALGWIEDMTNGWGLNVVMFNPIYLSSNLVERFYVIIVMFFFFFMTGMATASVYVRWKANGMFVFFGLVILLAVGLVWLATTTNSWQAVGNWFETMGLLGVVTWTLAPSALALITGYILLRRATPRN